MDRRPHCTLLHSVLDHPDTESVVAQHDRVRDALTDKLLKGRRAPRHTPPTVSPRTDIARHPAAHVS